MRYFGAFFAFFERFRFTWNTTTKTNCSTWNICFCTIFLPFGSVSHETPILLYFCYFQWNFSILWNVDFVWICRFSLHCRGDFWGAFYIKCLAKQFVHLVFIDNEQFAAFDWVYLQALLVDLYSRLIEAYCVWACLLQETAVWELWKLSFVFLLFKNVILWWSSRLFQR